MNGRDQPLELRNPGHVAAAVESDEAWPLISPHRRQPGVLAAFARSHPYLSEPIGLPHHVFALTRTDAVCIEKHRQRLGLSGMGGDETAALGQHQLLDGLARGAL